MQPSRSSVCSQFVYSTDAIELGAFSYNRAMITLLTWLWNPPCVEAIHLGNGLALFSIVGFLVTCGGIWLRLDKAAANGLIEICQLLFGEETGVASETVGRGCVRSRDQPEGEESWYSRACHHDR